MAIVSSNSADKKKILSSLHVFLTQEPQKQEGLDCAYKHRYESI